MADSLFRINRGITLNAQTSAPANPSNGDIYYDSSQNSYVFYNNGQWQNLSSRSDIASAASLTSSNFTAAKVQNSLIKLTGSTTGDIHGLAASSDAKMLVIYNSTNTVMSIKHESSTEATAANRIVTATLGDITLKSGRTATLFYDSTQSRWVLVQVAGADGGSGSGIGDDINSLSFKASFSDNFSDPPSDANTATDYSAGKTDSATMSMAYSYHRLNYDASKTLTGTGTAMALSADVTQFTPKAGDVIRFGSEVRKITTWTSFSNFVIEAAFSSNPSASACCISQAVHTKDLNSTAFDGLAISTAFNTSISQAMVIYEDTSAAADTIFDNSNPPLIAFSVSANGTSWSNHSTRANSITDSAAIVDLPASGTNMYIRFYANASSGAGACNILGYKAFFHRDTSLVDGSVLNQAYCFTDGVGAEINCSAPTVVSGKTRIALSFTYPVGVNAGTANGALVVYLNGQKIPRYVDATLTPDASYTEVSASIVDLNTDYSASNLSVEVIRSVAVVDASTENSSYISYMQEMNSKSMQSFVDESAKLSATTTVGSPASGYFYSAIKNRAQIPDISADLKVSMGHERIVFDKLVPIRTEAGANNERVWGLMNDKRNQIRFFGPSWNSYVVGETRGPVIQGANNTDYLEVVFYGTGLNLLGVFDAGRIYSVSIDGGAESTFSIGGAGGSSSVLLNRNYPANQVLNLTAGLTLGVHTAVIRATTSNAVLHGIEIVNSSTTLKVNAGSGYVNGKKITLASQQSPSYNSSFTNVYGTAGTKGGHVLVYLDADGTVKKDVRYTEVSQANFASASHANEEVIRTYTPREFGAGRSDDLSIVQANTAFQNKAFLLEDGSTALTVANVASAANFYNDGPQNMQGLLLANVSNNFAVFHFVGTGLDLVLDNGGTRNFTDVKINGVSIGASPFVISFSGTMKIVSGLPYGSHTVKFETTNVMNTPQITDFVVYGPKKPVLPTGAIELADYFLMADYDGTTITGTTTADILQMPKGVLAKGFTREMAFNGGGWTVGLDTSSYLRYGQPVYCSLNEYMEYTFFGTGFVINQAGNASSQNYTVHVDGVLDATGVVRSNGTNAGGGTYTNSAGVAIPHRVEFTGLTLGKHTIRITKSTNAGVGLFFYAIDIITPVHAPKSILPANIQSNEMIGSGSIRDLRQTTPIKDVTPKKAWAQANGIASGPTAATSGVQPPFPAMLPDMNLNIETSGGPIEISFNCIVSNSLAGNWVGVHARVNGVYIPESLVSRDSEATANYPFTLSKTCIVPVPAGVHNITLHWGNQNGTCTAMGQYRILIVKEL